MSEFDISEPDLLKREQTLDDSGFCRAVGIAEELDSIVDGHFEDVVDVAVAVCYVEDFLFVTVSVAAVAG